MSVYGKWKWKRLRIIKFEIIFECRFFAFVTVARGTCYASFIGISTGWKENFSLTKRWFFLQHWIFLWLDTLSEFPCSAIQREESKKLIETHRSVSELIMQTEIAMSGWRLPFFAPFTLVLRETKKPFIL